MKALLSNFAAAAVLGMALMSPASAADLQRGPLHPDCADSWFDCRPAALRAHRPLSRADRKALNDRSAALDRQTQALAHLRITLANQSRAPLACPFLDGMPACGL
ncbi:hypothetical protein BH10PSE17_BH10PSE17_05920 [soil metagenome]